MFALAIYYAAQHGVAQSSPALAQLALGISVACAVFASPGITLAAYEYAFPGRRASWALIGAVALIPAALVLLAATNDYHHLYWTGVELAAGSTDIVRNVPGPGFYGALLHGGVYSIISMVLIGQATLQSRGTIRKQGFGLLVAVSVPIVAHVAVYFVGTPTPVLSNPSLFNGFSLLVLAAIIVRYQLLELVPAGRGEFVERMPDGLVVVDSRGYIADCNAAAIRFLTTNAAGDAAGGAAGRSGRVDGSVVGRPFSHVASGWEGLSELGAESGAEGAGGGAVAPGGRHFQVSRWPLYDAGGDYIGHALLLRDVSEAHETRERVSRAAESMRIWESELDFYESVLTRQKHGR